MNRKQKFYYDNLQTIDSFSFTIRQIDVIACVVCNRGDKKIAHLCSISPKTVNTHIYNILLILGYNNREQIIDFVEKSGKMHQIRQYYTYILADNIFIEYLQKLIPYVESTKKKFYIDNIANLESEEEIRILNQLISDFKIIGLELDIRKNFDNLFTLEILKKNNIKKQIHGLELSRVYLIFDKTIDLIYLENNIVDFRDEDLYHISALTLASMIVDRSISPKILSEFQRKYIAILNSSNNSVAKVNKCLRDNIWSSIKRIVFYNRKGLMAIAIIFVLLPSAYFFIRKQMIYDANYVSMNKKNIEFSNISWNTPYIPEYIIQRNDIHKKIIEKLESNKGLNNLNLIGLSGLGGVGKTYIALYTIYHTSKDYSFKGWFTADNQDSIKSDYIKLGSDLGLFSGDEKEKEKIRIVKQWLNTQDSILLIFDNVPTMDVIEEYLPIKGDIVITSRNTKLIGLIEVDVMGEQESIKLLKTIVDDCGTEEEYRNLVIALGYLPLAIVQAGSFIKESEITISKYAQIYETEQNSLLFKNVMPILDKHEPAYVTWSIIIGKIKESDQTGKAIELLKLCSLCNFVNIPKAFLIEYLYGKVDNKTELQFCDLVIFLKQYSLIKITTEYLSMHHLVQDYIKYNITDQSRNLFLNKILSTIHSIYPLGKDRLEDYNMVKELLPHIQSFVNNSYDYSEYCANQFIRYLADIKYMMADYSGAKFLFKKSLVQRSINNNLIDNTYIKIALVKTYMMLGEYQGVEQLIEELQGEVSDVVKVQYNLLDYLGTAYLELGRYSEAEKVFLTSLNLKEYIYKTQEHINSAFSLKYLAKLYVSSGQYVKGKKCAEKALEIEHKYYGGYTNANISRTLKYLARALLELGYYSKAKEMLELSINVKKNYHHNVDDMHVAFGYRHLGIAYIGLGRYQEAKELLNKARDMLVQHYGSENHIDITHLDARLGQLSLYNK